MCRVITPALKPLASSQIISRSLALSFTLIEPLVVSEGAFFFADFAGQKGRNVGHEAKVLNLENLLVFALLKLTFVSCRASAALSHLLKFRIGLDFLSNEMAATENQEEKLGR